MHMEKNSELLLLLLLARVVPPSSVGHAAYELSAWASILARCEI